MRRQYEKTEEEWLAVQAEVHSKLYSKTVLQDTQTGAWSYIAGGGPTYYYAPVPDYLNDSSAMRELQADALRLKGWKVGVYKDNGTHHVGWVRKGKGRKALEVLTNIRSGAMILALAEALREEA